MVIEPEVGIHIFQNADPENPTPLKFIEAPGVHDIAIRGNLWCIDNSVDLVFFSYNYGSSLQIIKRHPKFFPEPFPPDLSVMPDVKRPGENFFIVNWIKTN